MQNMSRSDLLSLLDDLRQQVAEGATLEGQVRFSHSGCRSDIDYYNVAAMYRVGRGVRMVGVGGPQPIRCTRCHGEDGPFTDEQLCEPCARPMPLDGVA